MNGKDIVTIIISVLALAISGLTAWLTLLRKGQLVMTQPTPLLLAYDNAIAKVSFYSMMYSTAFRGQVIESLYVILRQSGQQHIFNKWVYTSDSIAYAAGCYVKPEGIAQNHQIFTSDNNFIFRTGSLEVDIYANQARREKPTLMKSLNITIPENMKDACSDKLKGVIFEWESDKCVYSPKAVLNQNELFEK